MFLLTSDNDAHYWYELLTYEEMNQSQSLANHPTLEIFHAVKQLSLMLNLLEIEIKYPVTKERQSFVKFSWVSDTFHYKRHYNFLLLYLKSYSTLKKQIISYNLFSWINQQLGAENSSKRKKRGVSRCSTRQYQKFFREEHARKWSAAFLNVYVHVNSAQFSRVIDAHHTHSTRICVKTQEGSTVVVHKT